MKINHANKLWPPLAGTAAAPILSTFHDLKETIDLLVDRQNFFSRNEPQLVIRAGVEIIGSAD